MNRGGLRLVLELGQRVRACGAPKDLVGLYLLPLLMLFVQGCFGAEYDIRVWPSGYS